MRNSLFQMTIAVLSLFLFSNLYMESEELYWKFLPANPVDPEFISLDEYWVDSMMQTLTLEEKIAQMIMIYAYSNLGESHIEFVERIVKRDKVGGILFFQGGPVIQGRMINRYQDMSDIPLLIAIDGEWGLGMRLDSTISYPRQMILGAIQDNDLIYQMGFDIAEQMKQLGINMNFAPVVDINNNPRNPVINTRSFGEDRHNVTEKVISYFSGMQDNRLLVAAKHFPGHGDTESDSHYTLPTLNLSRERLDSIELYPFREAVQNGLSGVMVAHLSVPVLDNRPNRPASLSKRIVNDVLIDQLGFKGLIVTDALNMKASGKYFSPGEIELEAVKAGNDILLMPADVHKAIQTIKKAVRSGELTEERIDHSCRKILKAKYWACGVRPEPVITKSLLQGLNSRKYLPLRHALAMSSLTLLRNDSASIPIQDLENIRLATVSIGKDTPNAFTRTTDLYLESDHYSISRTAEMPSREELTKALKGYDYVVINVYGTNPYASRRYGVTDQTVQFISSLDNDARMILNLAGNPYALSRFSDVSNFESVLVSYNEEDVYQEATAQALFGGLGFNGRLPVTIPGSFRVGSGIDTEGNMRLAYTFPESAGMSYDTLLRIDSMVSIAIANKAIPGCQVLVARKGKVVWHKAYGYHTYQNKVAVQSYDLYDLASITKIAATVPVLMHLRDHGRFHEDSLLKSYLPEAAGSSKGDLVIKDILSHQAGLESWIPFYYKTLEPLDSSDFLISRKWSYNYCYQIGNHTFGNRDVKYVDGVFESYFSEEHPVKVAGNLYMASAYRDTVYQTIYSSEIGAAEYKYSDLGYYLFQRSIECISDTMLYPYAYKTFYAPLGAGTLGYLPLNRFDESRIVPTENDMFFRRQLLRGYVHDPGAAMLGGIAGHAGLFSNSNDLAKIMQMYLNWGSYGGIRYLDSATIRVYSSQAYSGGDNRRALGFDRPVIGEPDESPACYSASASSYGHSGFTGTLVWLDPEFDLLFIFLSNRVHPNQSNTKLLDQNIRTNIQQVVYDAMLE